MEEIWKPVVGYENYYEVSNLGKIRSKERIIHYLLNNKYKATRKYLSVIRKLSFDKDGYPIVCLSVNQKHKTARVHQEVAKAFIENTFNKKSINHINSIKTDNRVSNLEWCTTKENTHHLIKYGKDLPRGEKHHNSIFKKEDILKIRELLSTGSSYASIARTYKCHWSSILSIDKKETWAHVV